MIVPMPDVEDIKDRLAAVERSHTDLKSIVAVLSNQMAGVIRLLWMILGALIVGIVGAFITAWVKVPTTTQVPSAVKAPPEPVR